MNLDQLLEDLREVKSKIAYMIVEVEGAIRQRRRERLGTEVKAFEEHWKSMGKSVDEQKATASLPMEHTVWGKNRVRYTDFALPGDPNKNTGIGKIEPYFDYIGHSCGPRVLDLDAMNAALKRTGWKDIPQLIVPMKAPAKAVEPSPQADGHVENDSPFDCVDDIKAYGDYRAAVYHSGPYYTVEAWKRMGRPRG